VDVLDELWPLASWTQVNVEETEEDLSCVEPCDQQVHSYKYERSKRGTEEVPQVGPRNLLIPYSQDKSDK
jgi:hypothetical protein